MNRVLLATITNLAYAYVGLEMIKHDTLFPIGIACFILTLGSGIHHYFLYKPISNFTILLDYFGMYAVLLSFIGVISGLSGVLVPALALSAGLTAIFRESRLVLGIVIGTLLLLVLITLPIQAVMPIAAMGYLAFILNQVGDRIHKEYHSLIHGGWHVLTAYTFLLLANALI